MESSFVIWLKEKQKAISLVVLILMALASGSYFFLRKKQSFSSDDYLQAQAIFKSWSLDPKKDSQEFVSLQKILHQHPEWTSRFEEQIANRLIAHHLGKEVSESSHKILEQSREIVPYHTHFASTTLLICKENLQEALMESKALKEAMMNDSQFWIMQSHSVKHYGTLLYAFNLMRIATLEKQLGSRQNEIVALEELEKYCRQEDSLKICDRETAQQIEKLFKEKDLTLSDYIQECKRQN